MYVEEYMHTDVITVTKDTLLADAQKIMSEHNIHRLPVVEKHKLIGLVTQDRIRETTKHPGIHVDTLQFLGLLAKMKVEDVMVTDVITVTPDTTVEEAVMVGQRHRVGTLPVVEGKRLVGIMTATDLYKLAAQVLGFGSPGVRLHIRGTEGRPIGEVTKIIASAGVEILSLVRITPPGTGKYESIILLNTGDASDVVTELMRKGYGVDTRSPIAAPSE